MFLEKREERNIHVCESNVEIELSISSDEKKAEVKYSILSRRNRGGK